MGRASKKRRKVVEEAPAEEDEEGDFQKVPAQAGSVGETKKRKEVGGLPARKWKAVEMDLSALQAFEGSGGLMFEEVDDGDEYGVAYSDGADGLIVSKGGATSRSMVEPAKKGKKKKCRVKAAAEPEADGQPNGASQGEVLEEENTRLKQELAALKAQKDELEDAQLGRDLPEWARFDLHPSLLRNLARLGFTTPTEVQARCLEPALRQRKDIVGAAETGSGKTLAFGLPILHHTLSASDGSAGLRAILILPTRELAVQVQSHITAAAQGTVVQVASVVGGMSVLKQQRLLRKQPQIVVATPGRLYALLGLSKEAGEEKSEWLRDSVKYLRHLVLDEADRLVESGHFKELDSILAHIYEAITRPQQLQTFVFSATLTLDKRSAILRKGRKRLGDDASVENGKVAKLINRLRLREARAVHIVDLTKPDAAAGDEEAQQPRAPSEAKKRQLPETLTFHQATLGDDKDREGLLAMWLLRRYRWRAAEAKDLNKPEPAPGGRVVIFVNAITMVMRLTPVLSLLLESPAASNVLAKVKMTQDKGREYLPGGVVEVLSLHSKLRQKERLTKMERFRSSKNALLVCTDIAARGLDVKDVSAVVHFQVPRSAEAFVHRSGRTARAGKTGESVAFVAPGDATQWNLLYRAVGISKAEVSDIYPTAFEVDAAKRSIRLAVDLEKSVHKISKDHQDRCWMAKSAEECDIILSSDGEDERERGRKPAARKQLWGLYQQLIARVRRPPKRSGGGPIAPAKRKRWTQGFVRQRGLKGVG